MTQFSSTNKQVFLHPLALKELNALPRRVQLKFKALFKILAEKGKLDSPYAKKLVGQPGLFEIRVKHNGQWRVIYVYLNSDSVLVLSAFGKKTKKTPPTQLAKAKNRLQLYLERKHN